MIGTMCLFFTPHTRKRFDFSSYSCILWERKSEQLHTYKSCIHFYAILLCVVYGVKIAPEVVVSTVFILWDLQRTDTIHGCNEHFGLYTCILS